MRMREWRAWVVAGVAMWVGAARAAEAGPAEAAPVAALPEVVVTALRSETALADVPGTVRVVDRAALNAAAPRTTPDALRGLPSTLDQ